MNDQSTSAEQPETLPEELPEQDTTDATTGRRWLPSTPAGKSRLVAAGVAGAFLLAGGLGGFAIGQAGDDHDRGGMVRPADFDGRGGPDGGRHGGPGEQRAPGDTSGGGTAS